MTTGLVLLSVLAAPFVLPAIVTIIFARRFRARREALAAREQVGRLCDPRDQELLGGHVRVRFTSEPLASRPEDFAATFHAPPNEGES